MNILHTHRRRASRRVASAAMIEIVQGITAGLINGADVVRADGHTWTADEVADMLTDVAAEACCSIRELEF